MPNKNPVVVDAHVGLHAKVGRQINMSINSAFLHEVSTLVEAYCRITSLNQRKAIYEITLMLAENAMKSTTT